MVYLRIDFYFIILFFLRGGGEKLALFDSSRGRNVCVLDLEQHRADDQRMTSKYRESDSKAVLWCHTAIVLRAQCRCITQRHIPEYIPEFFLHLHVLNPNCRENMTKHDWNCMQSNIALYFISQSVFFCSFCLTFDSYIHVQVQGFGTLKFQGTLNIHCVCVCSWNKSLERCDALFLLIWLISLIYSLF